jgi:hypothetical protein
VSVKKGKSVHTDHAYKAVVRKRNRIKAKVQFLVSFSNTSDRTNQSQLQIPFFTKNFPPFLKKKNAFWFGFSPTVFEKLRGLELARDIEKFTESVSLSVHSDFHDRNTSF